MRVSDHILIGALSKGLLGINPKAAFSLESIIEEAPNFPNNFDDIVIDQSQRYHVIPGVLQKRSKLKDVIFDQAGTWYLVMDQVLNGPDALFMVIGDEDEYVWEELLRVKEWMTSPSVLLKSFDSLSVAAVPILSYQNLPMIN